MSLSRDAIRAKEIRETDGGSRTAGESRRIPASGEDCSHVWHLYELAVLSRGSRAARVREKTWRADLDFADEACAIP